MEFNYVHTWEENNFIIKAFVLDQIASPDTFNVSVSAEDEMFLYQRNVIYGDKNRALLEYFRSGKEVIDRITTIINWKFQGFENVNSFLDFACGYGRITRYLVQKMSTEKIWVSDIYAEAVEFQKLQFGVNGIVSVINPNDYPVERKYDCIFVFSLFTHLPEKNFVSWLEKLYSMLSPNGILIFTVHDAILMPQEQVMPESGICFLPQSESRSLNKDEYGSTWVTESFVADAIAKASHGKALYHRIKKGLLIQDLYLVVNEPKLDFSSLNIGVRPRGFVDVCTYSKHDEITLKGWAADTSWTDEIKEIQVLLNGQLVQKCKPCYPRPDVVEFFKDERALMSGWTCSFYLDPATDIFQELLMVKMICGNNVERVLLINFIAATLQDLQV
ncbi:class I SAM-dependent methyltransferase [Phormidium sp. LEGE 05292]|uniref:class I SAM-dependent methyltransferase n=1 Tax=[Phormidium] sp. LEGE 05292 TaxID=767427 RepID=UPI001881B5DD|nr:class I SAM-dependent methyltransferase [Phormidium sp. LEGE 05292]MBE9225157.1 class I SAM-dependent methyltransferase [Phormidium sp. LEGE 05292]